MERKPRVVIERRGWMRVGHGSVLCDQGKFNRAPRVNEKGYTSEMQIGELLCVEAEEEGRPETFLE